MVELEGKPVCALALPDSEEVDVSLVLRFDDPDPGLVYAGWSGGGETSYWFYGIELRGGKVMMTLPLHLFEQSAQVVLKVGPEGVAEAIDLRSMPSFWSGVFQAGMRQGKPILMMVC